MNKTELAYAAGIIDGEGHIRLPSHRRSLVVGISNTDYALIEWLQERWPGRVIEQKVIGNRKPCWQWRLKTADSIGFLIQILPYLVIKHDLARRAIDDYISRA